MYIELLKEELAKRTQELFDENGVDNWEDLYENQSHSEDFEYFFDNGAIFGFEEAIRFLEGK